MRKKERSAEQSFAARSVSSLDLPFPHLSIDFMNSVSLLLSRQALSVLLILSIV